MSRRRVAYELRQKGWTYAAIARDFGVTSPRVRKLALDWERNLAEQEKWAEQDKIAEEVERQFEENELRFLSNYIDEIKELTT